MQFLAQYYREIAQLRTQNRYFVIYINMAQRYLNILVTWNNFQDYVPDESHERDCYFKNMFRQMDMHYFLVARETAPTTGHVHLHMVILMNDYMGGTWVRQRIPGANIQKIARGKQNIKRAIDYCRKEGEVLFENGDTDFLIDTRPTAESKHEAIMEKIRAGTLTAQDKDSYQYARMQRFYDQKVIEYEKKPRRYNGELKHKNLWIHGPTGTGKSKLIHDYAEERGLTIYNKLQNKWWDGYGDQAIVHIEEACPEKMRLLGDHMKQWADRYPFLAEVKGSSRHIEPSFNLIVTSNYQISDCFKEEDVPPLERRFDTLEMRRAPTPIEPEPTTDDFWEEWPQAQELPKTP